MATQGPHDGMDGLVPCALVIGLIDIGGTKLLAGRAVTASHPPDNVVRRATPTLHPAETLIDMLVHATGDERLDGIGLAVPGPFDRARGCLINPPSLSGSWHGLELAEILSGRFRCPVRLENDANCAALAEAHIGAGAGERTVVYFTLSTGIGSAVVVNGDLWIGRHDCEGGHQVLWPDWVGGPPCHCGGCGCFEALVGGRAIERRAGRRGEDVDDPTMWEEIGRWIGQAVVNATALLDPDVVVVGGGVCHAWERFSASMHATVDRLTRLQPPVTIRRATLGEDRNLWGARHLCDAALTQARRAG